MSKSKLRSEIKWIFQRVKNIYHLGVSLWFTLKYGYPAKKLTVIGVTGTDGKTTTCTLIYEMLRNAGGGIKPALLSTVSVKIGNQEIDTGLHTTNPDARLMQPLLARMVAEGVTHLVLEVTAHGLDQYRVWGCNISIGVLTNITHEHLDDFVDMKRYQEAKLKLFRNVRYAVVNKDGPAFNSGSNVQIIKYSKTKLKNISPALEGEYNLYNIGAAEAVARILGIQDNRIKRIVKEFGGVPGRREEVKAGQDFRVFVDFAHTPNALESVLKSLKKLKYHPSKHRLIVVFGCTGERDKEKRPVMGEIAARLADVVIITSDDTRGESQDEIAKQILAGIPPSNLPPILGGRNEERGIQKVWVENDRRKAIEMAVKMAKHGDIVILAGKGHEKSILHGTTEYPWSDRNEAENAIRFLQ